MNLSTKLVLSISTLAVFAVVTTYTSSGNTVRGILQKEITQGQSNTTAQSMDKIDRFLYEREIDIQGLTDRQQIRSYLLSPQSRTPNNATALVSQFNSFKAISGVWADFTLVDRSGAVLATTDQMVPAQSLAKSSQFTAAYRQALDGSVGYSDVFLEASTNEPLLLFTAPVRVSQTDQAIAGVMVGELAWPSVLQIISGTGSGLGSGTVAYIINKDGQNIGSSDPSLTPNILKQSFKSQPAYQSSQTDMSDRSQAAVVKSLTGDGQVVSTHQREQGYEDYSGNNWTLFFQTPTSIAFAPISHYVRNQVVLTILSTTIAITALVLYLFFFIIRPITRLQRGMEEIMDSNLQSSPKLGRLSKDEIGRLGTTFISMTEKLRDAYSSLRLRTEQAETQQKLTQTLIEKLPVGVVVVRMSDGKPLMTNHVAEEITGVPAAVQLSKANYSESYDVVKEDGSHYPAEERPLFIATSTGRAAMKEDLYIRRPDGRLVATRTIASPIAYGMERSGLAVSVFEDVTKERNLDRSREEFFSIASHELRTPLTAIRGNSDLIQTYYGDQLTDPNLKEMISDIHESANRLIEIVNDFLDTSRLEQKRMKFNYELVDMEELVHSVIKEYQVTSSRRQIAIEIIKPDKPLPSVFADRNRTKQVLINLVGNALKFTEKGTIKVFFETDSRVVKTLVRDTGAGMTLEAQNLLFRKFEQTGTSVLTRDSVRGTGLGLYISRMLIEQMHGHIQLESSHVGVGTTFSFTLPVAQLTDRPDVVHPDIISEKI